MNLGEKINWLITDRCNLNCSYCLSQHEGKNKFYEKNIIQIAQRIVDSEVKKVTISGGEPLLLKDFSNLLGILSDAGIYTSLHTNGFFVNKKDSSYFANLVGDVYLPLDSANKRVNDFLRGDGFFYNFEKAYDFLRGEEINVGIHTVVTPKNISRLEALNTYLREKDFFFMEDL